MTLTSKFLSSLTRTTLLLAILDAAKATAEQPQRSNVILVLADVLGYGDLGCYGATDIRTPNLDRMALEGTRLTDFCVVAPPLYTIASGVHDGAESRTHGTSDRRVATRH